MRKILFRGKDPDTGIWYEGFYMALSDTTYCFKEDYDAHPDNTKHYIVFEQMTDWGLPNRHLQAEVDPFTVGQCTGLKDKNGKRIFEGDILGSRYDDMHPDDITIEVVKWFRNGWNIQERDCLPDALEEDGVLPVVHGRFVEDDMTYPGAGLANYKCTVCGRNNGAWLRDLPAEKFPNYCWNCGAKMDGGAEHDAEQKAAASR